MTDKTDSGSKKPRTASRAAAWIDRLMGAAALGLATLMVGIIFWCVTLIMMGEGKSVSWWVCFFPSLCGLGALFCLLLKEKLAERAESAAPSDGQ